MKSLDQEKEGEDGEMIGAKGRDWHNESIGRSSSSMTDEADRGEYCTNPRCVAGSLDKDVTCSLCADSLPGLFQDGL